jgi:hypothetical protein
VRSATGVELDARGRALRSTSFVGRLQTTSWGRMRKNSPSRSSGSDMKISISGLSSLRAAEITELKSLTVSATFFGQYAEKNRMGVLTKLDNASEKLSVGKNADAIQKLTDFRTTVNSLAGGGKIAPGEAITCITALQTQTPTAA